MVNKSTLRNITKNVELRDCFARFALPVTLVSDNVPNFTFYEYETFLNNNGITHFPSVSLPFLMVWRNALLKR